VKTVRAWAGIVEGKICDYEDENLKNARVKLLCIYQTLRDLKDDYGAEYDSFIRVEIRPIERKRRPIKPEGVRR